jgi:hypothetical protein
MSTTVVTGYWVIPNKYPSSKFLEWFSNTLRVNCPYIVFGDRESLEIIKKYREGLPTHYIEKQIKDFYTYKFRDTIQAHPEHCPTKELHMIWSEKIFLMDEAACINPFGSEWFAWLDAGISSYRTRQPSPLPWPDNNKLSTLPKDKFLFTTSDSPIFKEGTGRSYYHYISGTFMLHRDFLKIYKIIWKKKLDELLISPTWRYLDQVVHTIIYREHPDLFHCLGHGYGAIGPLLEVRS